MENCRSRVESDQCDKRVGAILVKLPERMAHDVVGCEQRGNLPDKQFERRVAKHRSPQTSDWLDQEQSVEAVFVGFGNCLLQPRHALRERRQVSEIVPPDETHQADDPNQHTRRPVHCQKRDGEAGTVIDARAQPDANELDEDQQRRNPVEGNACLIEAAAPDVSPTHIAICRFKTFRDVNRLLPLPRSQIRREKTVAESSFDFLRFAESADVHEADVASLPLDSASPIKFPGGAFLSGLPS